MAHRALPAVAASPPRRGLRATIVTLLVVASLAVLLIVKALTGASDAGLGGQQFHDHLGFFTTTIPAGWSIRTVSADTFGYATHEGYQFQDLHKGDTTAFVQIMVGAPCHPVRLVGPTTNVDGEPATITPGSISSDAGYVLTFASANAYFEIWVDVPKIADYNLLVPTPTVTDPAITSEQADSIPDMLHVTDPGSCTS